MLSNNIENYSMNLFQNIEIFEIWIEVQFSKAFMIYFCIH